MSAVAFAFPVQPGKGAHIEEMLKQYLEAKSAELDERRRAQGFTRIKLFHQTRPVEQVVVYLEADDHAVALQNRHEDDNPFDTWFEETVEAISGHHPDNALREPPSQLIFDWHHERGGSRTHHD